MFPLKGKVVRSNRMWGNIFIKGSPLLKRLGGSVGPTERAEPMFPRSHVASFAILAVGVISVSVPPI